jgi:FkbM family methyltransferase
LRRWYHKGRLRLKAAIFERVLGPYVTSVVTEANGVLLAVDLSDAYVGQSLRRTGQWGTEELERLFGHLGPESNVLVVGGHVGSLTIPLAMKAKSVTVLEPDPRSFRLLSWNLRLNQMSNVTALPWAAGEQDETICFWLSSENHGGSRRAPKRKTWTFDYDGPTAIEVPSRCLDKHLAPVFDLVVMDIEGSETRALQGMQNILAACRCLAVEFVPRHLRDVAGVSVAEFVATVEPHFERLILPLEKKVVHRAGFLPTLETIASQGLHEDALLFEKVARLAQ